MIPKTHFTQKMILPFHDVPRVHKILYQDWYVDIFLETVHIHFFVGVHHICWYFSRPTFFGTSGKRAFHYSASV